MIQLIVGNKGSGKTKKLIDQVNEALRISKGEIVCIEKGAKLTYDLNHKVRLIDVDSYGISGFDMFYGFLAGMMAENYDITEIFIDGIFKICNRDYDDFGEFLEKLDTLSSEYEVQFALTVSADMMELPAAVQKFA